MYWAIGAATLLVSALLVDQIGLWAERRGWIYWRKRRRNPSGGAVTGAFGELQALLSPSYRHAISEMEAKKTLRVDQATGDRQHISIDLDRNVIQVPPSAGDPDQPR